MIGETLKCHYCHSLNIRVVRTEIVELDEKRCDCMDCGNHWYVPERAVRPLQTRLFWPLNEPEKTSFAHD